MSARAYDIVIVGGGIVGAACAMECARERLSVCVLEAGVPGGGATAAGMGHIVVMDDSEAQFALTRYSQNLWNETIPSLPSQAECSRTDTLWVAKDEEEMAEVRRKFAYYSERNVPVEILDRVQLAGAEPNLRKDLAGALLVPDDGVLYPPAAAKYLLDQAKARGAEMRFNTAVKTIRSGIVELQNGAVVTGGIVVNAAGAWSPELTPGIDVKKRKGHLVITDRYPGFVRHQIVELGYLKSAHSLTSDSVAFNVQPRVTGQVLIGSSRQYDVEGGQIDMPILSRMVARACEYMPSIASLRAIRMWTGFRAATPDKLPLIGPAHDDEKLYLATGHEGLGITTSLATGKLIVDQIMKRPSMIPCQPYLPERFMKRAAGHEGSANA